MSEAVFDSSVFNASVFECGSVTPVVIESPSGGWHIHVPSAADIRRERERLGILPKQAKIIDKALGRFEQRLSGGLADTLRQYRPRDVLAYIEESQDYRALLSRLALEAKQRQAVADYIAQAMLAFVMAQRAEDDEVLTLMMMVH